MRIDYILKSSAKRMANVEVTINRSFGTVCIRSLKNDLSDIFMQGDDAEKFISECDSMSERCKHLSFDLIELALAEQYAECLWN